MKSFSKMSQVKLPTIRTERKVHVSLTYRSGDYHLEESMDKQNQKSQINQLDQWTARKTVTNVKSKSKIINILYRNSLKKGTKTNINVESSLLTQAKLFLLRLNAELRKVNDIKYSTMYKNIQYCTGVYESFYSDILRQNQRLLAILIARKEQLENCIDKKRSEHIKSLQNTNSSYKLRISAVRESIEEKQLELQPLKTTIQNLEIAKVNILKHCLYTGYDVRNQGLIWIIRKLDSVPSAEEFPPFLTQKQINFIKNKYKNQLKQQQKTSQLKSDPNRMTNFGKTTEQICQIIGRKKKRQLSMIRQGDVLSQLQEIHNSNYRSQHHKYINDDVLKIAQQTFPKTKHTKYEIIYKETTKKLNKYCVNEIYKNINPSKTKDIAESRRESLNTLRILSHFQAKIEDYLRRANTETKIQSAQERQLDQIIRALRYENYQQNSKMERNQRNPVSVICCLVGHQKAKRIVQQELNHLL